MIDPKYFSAITEYDEERTRLEFLLDGFEEGFIEMYQKTAGHECPYSRKEITFIGLKSFVKKGKIPIELAAKTMGMSVSEFESKTGLKS